MEFQCIHSTYPMQVPYTVQGSLFISARDAEGSLRGDDSKPMLMCWRVPFSAQCTNVFIIVTEVFLPVIVLNRLLL